MAPSTKLNTHDELRQLKDVFYNKYRFNVETFDIPSEYPLVSNHLRVVLTLTGEETQSQSELIDYGEHSAIGMASVPGHNIGGDEIRDKG
jgi:hypothetical protein